MAGNSYQDALSGHRDQNLSYFYEALVGPVGKDRNMAKMDGNSVTLPFTACLIFGCRSIFDVGYCCFAKQQFCEADEILVVVY